MLAGPGPSPETNQPRISPGLSVSVSAYRSHQGRLAGYPR